VKRIVPFVMVAAMVAASLASPNPASAQSRAVARPATRATGHAVARPSYGYPAYRPNYRYGYPYRGYGYGYPYYGYGYGYPYYGTSFAFGVGIGFGIGFGWGYPYYGYGPYGYPFHYGAWGYPYGGPYPYPYGYYDYSGAARLEVKPREAEVYVDGYLVGTVDNFDGWAQRLNVAPGEHQLVIYLKGHHTFRENVLFRPGATLRVEHVMQPLGPGDAEEPRPVPDRTAARASVRRDPQDYPPPQDYPRQPGDPASAPRRGEPDQPAQSSQYGSLAVRVQPLDAEVIVDGEPWQSPDAGSITLQLSEGVHRVEVRKQGYRTYSAEVRVRRGDSTAVNVSLSRN
jgi:PEGA domain